MPQGDAGNSKPDAGNGGDDDDAGSGPSEETGNTIYTDGPECPARGHRIAGTVDGETVEFDLPMESENSALDFEARQAGSENGRLSLDWDPALDEGGEPSEIFEGVLELATKYEFGPYCVLAGKAQSDSKLTTEGAHRRFFTVTKVRAREGIDCIGPELEADLKACTYYR